MNPTFEQSGAGGGAEKPAWAAVVSMALGVFSLVTAEFLPASLLTPIAAELNVTEGAAGQAVTATAVVGMIASLLIAPVARGVDRRHLMMFFSLLLIFSNLLVAFAPGLTLLLIGRVLLGAAIGGFWAMATAVTMRLVPPVLVPRALSMIFSGVSAATVVAAPLGSYLGALAGWRAVFVLAAGLGLVALVMQFLSLPKLRPTGAASLRVFIDVLARPGIALGIVTATLVFAGHFAFFTYLRPFLETDGGGIEVVSSVLLGFGLANFLGTLAAGPLIGYSLRLTLTLMPLLMAGMGFVLVAGDTPFAVNAIIVALWGLVFGGVPVAWSTWLARNVPDEAESAGGLLVAAIQFSIAMGAALGGIIFDANGVAGVFMASSLVLVVAAIGILLGVKQRPVPAAA